jgi:hypothetical protein
MPANNGSPRSTPTCGFLRRAAAGNLSLLHVPRGRGVAAIRHLPPEDAAGGSAGAHCISGAGTPPKRRTVASDRFNDRSTGAFHSRSAAPRREIGCPVSEKSIERPSDRATDGARARSGCCAAACPPGLGPPTARGRTVALRPRRESLLTRILTPPARDTLFSGLVENLFCTGDGAVRGSRRHAFAATPGGPAPGRRRSAGVRSRVAASNGIEVPRRHGSRAS